MAPTVLSAQAFQFVQQVSLSPCPDVPGPPGKVLISNVYPEKSPPRGGTEIVSSEVEKRLRCPGGRLLRTQQSLRSALSQPHWPGPLLAPTDLAQERQHGRGYTQVLEPAVLGSGCVTSGKSLRSPGLGFLIFDMRIMTAMSTLFSGGKMNECAKPRAAPFALSLWLLFQAVKTPCWLDFPKYNKLECLSPTHTPH